jgi:periplasmic protein TonB
MMGASLLVHAVLAFWCWTAEFEPPRVISPQQGKASILLRASAAARPKPAEEILQKKPTELPLLPEDANPQYQVPKPATSQIEPILRPTETAQANPPALKADAALHAPPQILDLAPRTEQVAETPDSPAMVAQAAKLEATLPRPKSATEAAPTMRSEKTAMPPVDIPTLDPLSKPALPQAAYAKIPLPKPASLHAESMDRPQETTEAKTPDLKADPAMIITPELHALEALKLPGAITSDSQAKAVRAEPSHVEAVGRPQRTAQARAPDLKADPAMLVSPDLRALEALNLPVGTMPDSKAKAVLAAPSQVEAVERPHQTAEPKTPDLKADPAMLDSPEPRALEILKMPVAKTPAAPAKPLPGGRPEPALARPKTTKDVNPALTGDSTTDLPVELPPLDPSSTTAERAKAAPAFPPVQTAKDGPQSLPRPIATEAVPKLEAITKIAELIAVASEASDPSQGVTADELPQKLNINPPPPYPAEAIAAGQQGTVLLRVKIDAAGKILTISVYISSGTRSLDDAALSTVRTWVFVPARRAGRAIPYEVLVPIEFFIRRRF